YQCSCCNHREDMFGHGGVKAAAEKMDAPFLGEIPLHIDVRKAADAGIPIVLANPDHDASKTYRHMAGALAAGLELGKRKKVFGVF
ncbi:MAG: P-loop NTPase, partial [Alphaproteobacteria bacterium]|nr:P-loop NTPase [Alphaproteobacteria bacterium]